VVSNTLCFSHLYQSSFFSVIGLFVIVKVYKALNARRETFVFVMHPKTNNNYLPVCNCINGVVFE
jgi:hypothetical protein